MYLCLDCENIFEEPEYFMDIDDSDDAASEMKKGCPHCGGEYIETVQCSICGQWVTGEYVEMHDGTIVCDECYFDQDELTEGDIKMWGYDNLEDFCESNM